MGILSLHLQLFPSFSFICIGIFLYIDSKFFLELFFIDHQINIYHVAFQAFQIQNENLNHVFFIKLYIDCEEISFNFKFFSDLSVLVLILSIDQHINIHRGTLLHFQCSNSEGTLESCSPLTS